MVIISSKKYKELQDKIASMEQSMIGLELKVKDLSASEYTRRKAVSTSQIQDEWLNGKPNAK